jgi:Acetyltransferase (GNAT) domain
LFDGTQFCLRPFSDGGLIWQQLLARDPAATLYHRDAWIDLVFRSYRLPIWLATLHRDGAVVSGCILARSKNPFAQSFVSLPFSDNCAPLAVEGEGPEALLDALTAQASPGTAYEIRGVSAGAPWHTVECFVRWRLDFDRSLAGIERRLDVNFRRNLRRAAQQGISVDRGSGPDYIERFYAMQLVSRRRFGLPPQPRSFFNLVQTIFGPGGNLDIWIARQGGEDLAGAVFIREGDLIHYKWGARRQKEESGANHLLFWNAIEAFAGCTRACELGRTDVRNRGLMRFKKALGATAVALPYSYYPRAPGQISPEVLTGARKLLAGIWKRLPISATEMLGRVIYGFLG